MYGQHSTQQGRPKYLGIMFISGRECKHLEELL
jgi:hypothetical protein